MIQSALPDLQVIEKQFVEELNKLQGEDSGLDIDGDDGDSVYIFTELFSRPALGFRSEVYDNTSRAYTTILISKHLKYAGVFCGDRLVYIIPDPNGRFYRDIDHHWIASISEAMDIHTNKSRKDET